MSKILSPITLRAASLTLPASLATVVGTVSTDAANGTSGAVLIGSLSALRLVCSYARHGSSTTGRPIFAVDVSMDAPSTSPASVTNWCPIALLDTSTFTSGRIDGYAMAYSLAPRGSGTTIHGTPPLDVRGANWIRVRMADVDVTNRGAITNLAMGGEA